jgi:hypothetical protein
MTSFRMIETFAAHFWEISCVMLPPSSVYMRSFSLETFDTTVHRHSKNIPLVIRNRSSRLCPENSGSLLTISTHIIFLRALKSYLIHLERAFELYGASLFLIQHSGVVNIFGYELVTYFNMTSQYN